jgi:hypothetical protein
LFIFVFSVSKGASVDPSVDTSTNKRLRSVAGEPCGNIRDLVADSEEGAEMAQHDSADEASVTDGSTEVPPELGALESALATTAASVEVAIMGSAAVCAVSAASAAFAKRLSIL